MTAVRAPLPHLLRDRRAAIAVETGLIVPFLVILIVGAVDLTFWVQNVMLMDRVASSTSDTAARTPNTDAVSARNHQIAAVQIARNADLLARGRVIISRIDGPRPDGTPARVTWQTSGPPNGLNFSLQEPSRIAPSVGNPPRMPTGFALGQNENLIVTEVFYDYPPLLLGGTAFGLSVQLSRIYAVAFYTPRPNPTTRS